MAYVSKELKAEIASLLKEKFGDNARKRGFKYSLRVRNHSTIVMTISEGRFDFISDFVEHAHISQEIREHYEQKPPKYIDVRNIDSFSAECKKIIEAALECLNHKNWDRSDSMTDYFDVGHYVDLQIGSWDKPYKYNKEF